MSTEATWEKYYRTHQGVYAAHRLTDRTDPDGMIANAYQITYLEAILEHRGNERSALELGCGSNPIFDVLNAFGSICYTDISDEALSKAKESFELIAKTQAVRSRVVFKKMNVEEFDFPDNAFDVVFNTRAPHRDTTSRELFRAIRSGGAYVYQTIGEQDLGDLKLLLKGGRGYEDYLVKNVTRFQVIKDSLVGAGFRPENINLLFDRSFKNFFDSKQALKEKLWLLVGDHDFDLPRNDAVLDAYIAGHRDKSGKIFAENHRLVIKAVKP